MTVPSLRHRKPFLGNRPFLRYFVPLFAATTLLAAVGFIFVERSRVDTWEQEFRADQVSAIQGVGQTLTQPIVDAAGDLAILAEQDALTDLSATPTDAELDTVARIFEGLSSIRRVYDQIRFIDMAGMERVRVDFRGGEVLRVANLQDKSGRYYFANTVDLPRGAIFVSPLDLNVEQGEIERPLKPMLRLGSPVFAADGTQRGVLISITSETSRSTPSAMTRARSAPHSTSPTRTDTGSSPRTQRMSGDSCSMTPIDR